MDKKFLVSIIINNYNYDRFLSDAIGSAIHQTYSNIEVIVVDDGSTDNSVEVIGQYGDKITTIIKDNGGQASAFNVGFEVSKGDIILFLDSDDILLPSAVASVVELFKDSGVSKVHWSLWEIDEFGQKKGGIFPGIVLPEGNLLDEMIKYGPNGYISAPTSGNAWSRRFLEQVLPMPTEAFKISADGYLFMLAPLFGSVRLIKEPQSFYRIHGKNNYKGKTLQEEKLNFITSHYDQSCLILQKYLNKLGIDAETERWKDNSWFYKVLYSINEIKNLIPVNESFILVDEDQWEATGEVAGRKAIPFLEQNGEYWGTPTDDNAAVREIERQRENGANYIVFAWPAFWWLDYYSGMHDYLKSHYKCTLQNERLIAFNLL